MVHETESDQVARLVAVHRNLSTLIQKSERAIENLDLLKEHISSIEPSIESQHASLRRTLAVTEKGLLADVLDEIQEYLAHHQMSMTETLELLASSNDSIARFGDGELRAIFNPWFRFSFQNNSVSLSNDLSATLENHSDGMRVALPLAGRDRFWAGLYPLVWAQLRSRLTHRFPDQSPLSIWGSTRLSFGVRFGAVKLLVLLPVPTQGSTYYRVYLTRLNELGA